MSPIRILHASDLHLAEYPLRSSVIDSTPVKLAAARELVSDIVDAIRHGSLGDLTNVIGEHIVSPLAEAVRSFDRKRLNEQIDAALMKIARSDILIDYVNTEILRKVFAASSYNPGAVDCLCNFIEGDGSFDALVLTGDIATTGLSQDLEKAREFLEGPATDEDSTIAGLVQRVHLLPGNHDRFIFTGNGFLYAPGGDEFERILGQHWSGKVKLYDPPLRSQQEELSVLIVAADFGLQRSADCTWPLLAVGRLAQGRVYPDVLAELERVTKAAWAAEQDSYPNNTIVILWAIHFPPFFPYAGRFKLLDRRTKNLIDEQELVAKAAECGVQAILAGHTHRAKDYMAGEQGVCVLCAGTATQHEDYDRQIQIINISIKPDGGVGIDLENYLLDLNGSTFVESPVQTA